MKEVKVNSKMKLSEHFALGELTKTSIWLHFAVRPHGNRRKIEFLKA